MATFTQSEFLVTTGAAVAVLAPNKKRVYLLIQNRGNGNISLSIGGIPDANNGVILSPLDYLEFDNPAVVPIDQTISCIAIGSDSRVSVIDGTGTI